MTAALALLVIGPGSPRGLAAASAATARCGEVLLDVRHVEGDFERWSRSVWNPSQRRVRPATKSDERRVVPRPRVPAPLPLRSPDGRWSADRDGARSATASIRFADLPIGVPIPDGISHVNDYTPVFWASSSRLVLHVLLHSAMTSAFVDGPTYAAWFVVVDVDTGSVTDLTPRATKLKPVLGAAGPAGVPDGRLLVHDGETLFSLDLTTGARSAVLSTRTASFVDTVPQGMLVVADGSPAPLLFDAAKPYPRAALWLVPRLASRPAVLLGETGLADEAWTVAISPGRDRLAFLGWQGLVTVDLKAMRSTVIATPEHLREAFYYTNYLSSVWLSDGILFSGEMFVLLVTPDGRWHTLASRNAQFERRYRWSLGDAVPLTPRCR